MISILQNRHSLLKYPVLLMYLFLILLDRGHSQTPSEKVALPNRFDPKIQSYAFVIPNLTPVRGVGGIRAKDCGLCHKTIYREWKQSTHASAIRDIQYQSEITKDDSPKWLCLNCHLPLQNQRKNTITHLLGNDIFRPVKIPNPSFDTNLQKEAITCATCHIRSDDNSEESYIVGPNGSKFAPHPVREDPNFLRNICQRCHNPQGEGLTPNLICWFETTKELAEGQSALKKIYGKNKDCVDCHMPEQKRLVAEDFTTLSPQNVNRHHWTGSGIPKWFDGYDNLLARGYEPGLKVQVIPVEYISTAKETKFNVLLKNARAGHYLPTGDPERFILAIATLEDAAGKRLHQQNFRIGQTWEWNPAHKIGDNRLKQGEEKLWKVTFPLPDQLMGLKVRITVYHVRLRSETAKHIMNARGIDEELLKNGNHFVRNAIDYYPFASYIFNQEINLTTRKSKIYKPEELIKLSKGERGKSLSSRAY